MMREGFCMKRKTYGDQSRDVIFRPALTPLEAAMIPAEEKPRGGALRHVMRETERRFALEGGETQAGQRAKIWVR